MNNDTNYYMMIKGAENRAISCPELLAKGRHR